MNRRLLVIVSLSIPVLTLATACSRSDAGPDTPASQAKVCPAGLSPAEALGKPIKIGNVSSLSGPGTFPEASAAAKAVFDRLNECGGVNGRPVRLSIEDDQGDSAVAAQAARRLAEQEDVVAMVGSASLLDCAVNSTYYGEQNLSAIQGTGVDPVCFSSPSISPVNTGPFTGVTVALYYASEVLGKEDICRIRLFDIPGFGEAFDAAAERWETITGKTLKYTGAIGKGTDDPTPLLLRARDEGCDAVVVDGVEPHAIAVGKAVRANGLGDISWIGLTSYYTDNVAKQLGATGDGLVANSEFEPYGGESPALEDVRGLMQENDIPMTSFAEGGYLAATIAQDVLLGIQGEITRDSVSRALRELENYETPLVGSPYSFGPGESHAPNQSSKFVVLEDGTWTEASPDWVTLPAE